MKNRMIRRGLMLLCLEQEVYFMRNTKRCLALLLSAVLLLAMLPTAFFRYCKSRRFHVK